MRQQPSAASSTICASNSPTRDERQKMPAECQEMRVRGAMAGPRKI